MASPGADQGAPRSFLDNPPRTSNVSMQGYMPPITMLSGGPPGTSVPMLSGGPPGGSVPPFYTSPDDGEIHDYFRFIDSWQRDANFSAPHMSRPFNPAMPAYLRPANPYGTFDSPVNPPPITSSSFLPTSLPSQNINTLTSGVGGVDKYPMITTVAKPTETVTQPPPQYEETQIRHPSPVNSTHQAAPQTIQQQIDNPFQPGAPSSAPPPYTGTPSAVGNPSFAAGANGMLYSNPADERYPPIPSPTMDLPPAVSLPILHTPSLGTVGEFVADDGIPSDQVLGNADGLPIEDVDTKPDIGSLVQIEGGEERLTVGSSPTHVVEGEDQSFNKGKFKLRIKRGKAKVKITPTLAEIEEIEAAEEDREARRSGLRKRKRKTKNPRKLEAEDYHSAVDDIGEHVIDQEFVNSAYFRKLNKQQRAARLKLIIKMADGGAGATVSEAAINRACNAVANRPAKKKKVPTATLR